MVEQGQTQDFAGFEAGRDISAWWWLGVPVAALVLLVAFSLGAPGIYARWIESEQGLLELSHVLIPVAAMIVALRTLVAPTVRRSSGLVLWLALAALANFYVAGEEASWGQHYLQWATPESWQAVNDQGETNLHNISSWFDQKPRLILELGVIIGGIVIPLALRLRPALGRLPIAVIFPPLLCLPTAVLAEVTRLTERLPGIFGGDSLVFTRASEVQEFYFYLFVLLYLIALRRRLLSEAPDRPTA